MMNEKTFRSATLGLYLAASACLVLLSWLACAQYFVYPLDDPYIHLSIAETIAQGGYGINSTEYSSPSSSILFPFLLAPFASFRFGEFMPLVIGIAAQAVSVWVLAGFFFRHIAADAAGRAPVGWLALSPLLILAINGVALPVVGMEHPLHVLAVVLTMTGLAELGETGRFRLTLALGIILGPLIRFEGLALSGATLLVLLWRGDIRRALVIGTILVGCLGAYLAFMLAHGLPPLPSSVLVKSAVSADAMDSGSKSMAATMAKSLFKSFDNRWGMLFAIGILVMLPSLRDFRLRGWTQPRTRLVMILPAMAALAAHMLLGSYGWFGRYEVYAVAILLIAVIAVLAVAVRAIEPLWLRIATCAFALLLPAIPYLQVTAQTPSASRNIYQQQYQMHRFVADYFPHPLAVNDIGFVSYRNDRFVLDLWGLGSEEVRKLARSGQRTPAAVDALAKRRGIAFAMVYDTWLKDSIPASWRSVARLTTSNVTAGGKVVTFYLVDPALAGEMNSALARFAPTLPSDVTFEIEPTER